MAAFWKRGKPVEAPKVRPAVCVSGEDLQKEIGLTYDNSNITLSPGFPVMDFRAIL